MWWVLFPVSSFNCSVFNNLNLLPLNPNLHPLPDVLSSPQTLWALPVRTRRQSWPTSLASTTPSQALRRYPGCSVSFLLLLLFASLPSFPFPHLHVFLLTVSFSLQCTTPPAGVVFFTFRMVHTTKCMMGQKHAVLRGSECKCVSSLPCCSGTAG